MTNMSRHHSWDLPNERKNLGFLFAIEHGAREVVDVISGEYLPGNHCFDDYIGTYCNCPKLSIFIFKIQSKITKGMMVEKLEHVTLHP